MDKKLEALWSSTFVTNEKTVLKAKHRVEIEEKEEFIDKILSSCNNEVAYRFVPWLYDYVTIKEKIAFEIGYKLAKKYD